MGTDAILKKPHRERLEAIRSSLPVRSALMGWDPVPVHLGNSTPASQFHPW
jgi:hypothetical protein